ncbi:hypothetical protein JHK82_030101 [Glycine max]|uniref:Uncharacterized protein n=1 Tax=Glycine soja TaxID=3848 RepID=A0A0B2PYZ9_GLYSO|nr:hypothetical protein JHK85_030727 [Glycine max]KHN12988.1 hypothetical protein glysoja_027276 [Glycine soja]KAG5123364.1 hypothetical protein JHK82_030101 [Glycine max]KAG5144784.1 hypothetical protein JHK84_030327 [Glycine max]KAH1157658.1 hypothetical protein GYH30_030062 [Glycine max]
MVLFCYKDLRLNANGSASESIWDLQKETTRNLKPKQSLIRSFPIYLRSNRISMMTSSVYIILNSLYI